jgi:pSer/pThr/pTyr-binding forkhead associated (FHA) protein
MPLLQSGAERCTLQTGTYTLGGNGPGALPLSCLEWCAAVATVIVPPSGPSTIQRIAASVVVRLNRVPIGIAPIALNDGVQIEFEGHCVTFRTGNSGSATVSSALSGVQLESASANAEVTPASAVPATHSRIVNTRTGDAIALGDQRVVVGRDEACDLVVAGMGVSRRHFTVTPVQGGYVLRDESANGTIVNGSPVSGTYLLGHGDVVRLDDVELRFELEGVALPSASSAAAPTAIIDMTRLRREHAGGARREHPAPLLAATLEIVRGPYAGASFSIDRPVCSIGRGPQSDVRIRDDSVSTNHATLLRKGATWFVVDLRSANGTFVDGLRVAGEREVTSGSRLKLGSVHLVFRSLDAVGDGAKESKRKGSWVRELLKSFRRTAADSGRVDAGR